MSEQQLQRVLAVEGLAPSAGDIAMTTWSNGPGAVYDAHRHGFDKVLFVDDGSIRFSLPELGRDVELAAGDRLDLRAGTLHAATVGRSGVTCVEAHLGAGSLPPETAPAPRS